MKRPVSETPSSLDEEEYVPAKEPAAKRRRALKPSAEQSSSFPPMSGAPMWIFIAGLRSHPKSGARILLPVFVRVCLPLIFCLQRYPQTGMERQFFAPTLGMYVTGLKNDV